MMTRYKEEIFNTLVIFQSGSRELGAIKFYAKKRKNALLLTKLCPELKAANEKFMREFIALATVAGFGEAVSIKNLQVTSIDVSKFLINLM